VCVSATSACVGGAIVHISKMERWRAYLAQVARERLLRATRRPGRAWMPQVIGFDPRPRALCAREHGYGVVMSMNGGHRVCATFGCVGWWWWRWRGPKQHTNAQATPEDHASEPWNGIPWRGWWYFRNHSQAACACMAAPPPPLSVSKEPTTADPPHAHCPCAAFFNGPTQTHMPAPRVALLTGFGSANTVHFW
jgi:hypothetical protein